MLAGGARNPYFQGNEGWEGASVIIRCVEMKTWTGGKVKKWLGATGKLAVTTGLFARWAYAQETKSLAEQAKGNAYWSWALFVILGLIVFFLVFKGTRTR